MPFQHALIENSSFIQQFTADKEDNMRMLLNSTIKIWLIKQSLLHSL